MFTFQRDKQGQCVSAVKSLKLQQEKTREYTLLDTIRPSLFIQSLANLYDAESLTELVFVSK